MTFAELLKSQGADDETIKLLDTPVARKAFDVQQATIADLDGKAKKSAADYTAIKNWYDTVAQPTTEQWRKERDTAIANQAAADSKLAKLQELGLIEVAEKMEPGSTVVKKEPAVGDAFDPKKHNLVTADDFKNLADAEGDAIAIMADIAEEHRDLFGSRINARELRKEAKAAGKTVEQHWMEKFSVQAKRDEKAKADKAAYEKKLTDAAIAKDREERGVNPLLAPGIVSRTPFANAKEGANVLPWEKKGDSSTERVNKVMKSLAGQGLA